MHDALCTSLVFASAHRYKGLTAHRILNGVLRVREMHGTNGPNFSESVLPHDDCAYSRVTVRTHSFRNSCSLTRALETLLAHATYSPCEGNTKHRHAASMATRVVSICDRSPELSRHLGVAPAASRVGTITKKAVRMKAGLCVTAAILLTSPRSYGISGCLTGRPLPLRGRSGGQSDAQCRVGRVERMIARRFPGPPGSRHRLPGYLRAACG